MRMDDMIIVSVDDHVCEPPGFLDQHIDRKYHARLPKCNRDAAGKDIWVFPEGSVGLMNVAINAVVGRPREELGWEPNSYDQIRRGCIDPKARVGDLSANGILASVNFPNTFGFVLEAFQNLQDKQFALALIRAYNDYHLDEWVAQYPTRFIPLSIVPLWDMQLAVQELKRTVAKGVKTVSFPSLPTQLGLPSIHDAYWKPLWDAIADEGLPLSVHIGGGGGSEHVSPDSPFGAWLNKVALSSMTVASEWLWSSLPFDYPNLKVVLSEGGIGWLPYFLERADLIQKNHPWLRKNWHGKRPSDVFREHFVSCFIQDIGGVEARHEIGIDIITFENDYPHADVTWPHTPEQLWNGEFKKGAVSDEDINKITYQNALKIFDFDPFSKVAREECTVGALRAQAKDVDLTIVSRGGIPPSDDPYKVVTASDVIKQFSFAPIVPKVEVEKVS